MVLVDGVRIGSATLGQAEFEALSLSQIERIEVLRGPASSLYGADAVGGVIQIFTRRGEGAPRVTGAAAIGGYRSRQGDLGVSGSQGPFDYAVVARRREERRRLGGPARRRLRHLQSRRRRLLPQVGEPASRLDAGARAIGSASACSRAA